MLLTWTRLRRRLRLMLVRPTSELTRAQKSIVYAIDLSTYCARALRETRATQMAAALTYRTIFSLVPLLVLSLVVIRAFGGFEQIGDNLKDRLYDYMGVQALTYQDEGPEAAAGAPEAAQQVQASVEKAIQDLTQHLSQVQYGSIGVVGAALLIWAALALVITVEQCFNTVYRSPSGRPWHLRLTIYWAVITGGPVLLMLSLYVAGVVSDSASRWPVLGNMLSFLGQFTALGASWLLFLMLYLWMPTTRVSVRAALIGSFIAAVLWELTKWGFALYVDKLVPFSKVYGSLGLIPLFLLWLYVSWLIVLFGLQVTYTLQTLPDFRRQRRQARRQAQVSGDPMWVVPIMVHIGRAFEQGRTPAVSRIAEELGLSPAVVAEFGHKLEAERLVHRVDTPQGDGYTPAMPVHHIAMPRLLSLAQRMGHQPGEVDDAGSWAYLDRLSKAQRRAAEGVSLADVLNSTADP